MLEKVVDIETADGTMNSYVYCPDEGGPFPVVLMYMDSAGVREPLANAIKGETYFGFAPSVSGSGCTTSSGATCRKAGSVKLEQDMARANNKHRLPSGKAI